MTGGGGEARLRKKDGEDGRRREFRKEEEFGKEELRKEEEFGKEEEEFKKGVQERCEWRTVKMFDTRCVGKVAVFGRWCYLLKSLRLHVWGTKSCSIRLWRRKEFNPSQPVRRNSSLRRLSHRRLRVKDRKMRYFSIHRGSASRLRQPLLAQNSGAGSIPAPP